MKRDCERPLSDPVLIEWWTGEVQGPERRFVEEHLLGCDSCSARARVLSVLAEGVASLVRIGRIQTVVTAEVVERMRREGRKVREYRVNAGGGVQCTVAPDDDFLVARLQARLEPGERLDLFSRIDDGPESRVPDLPCIPGAFEVIVAEPVDEIGARPAHVQRLRLVAVGTKGERLIGEYTFNHTPWPGPAGGDSSA
jgi:hypothetical protein